LLTSEIRTASLSDPYNQRTPRWFHPPKALLTVVCYRTATGKEPVREWLLGLPRQKRKASLT
jgi:hypothetical protein